MIKRDKTTEDLVDIESKINQKITASLKKTNQKKHFKFDLNKLKDLAQKIQSFEDSSSASPVTRPR